MKGFFFAFAIIFLLPIVAVFTGGKDVYATIYELFTFLYGQDLRGHLYGYNGVDFADNSLYVPIGLILYYVTLGFILIFYYWIGEQSSRFARWYHWLIVLFINAAVHLFIGFYLPYLDYSNGEIESSIAVSIDNAHLWYFGLTNIIYSILLFIIFSYSLRWWSTNCSTTPIPQ